MAMRSILQPAAQTNLYVCPRCSFRARNGLPKVSKRAIGTKFLAKVANAEKEWEERAKLIKNNEVPSMLSILEERGYINQIAGKRETLDLLLTNKRIGAYVGIDPTAPSIHIGHMVPLMSLFWMYVHGYNAVSLLGGATAKIGDPTGRSKDREKIHRSLRTEYMVKMHFQLKKLWANVEAYGRRHGYKWEWAWKRDLANNNAWMNKLGVLELLQTLGPGMRMGAMLSRDSVKTKMSSSDGMSYAEFTYPLLQAWDWWHMYLTKSPCVQLQIGGSDQFGNIVAGVDAINYMRTSPYVPPEVLTKFNPPDWKNSPIGFTTPLLTNSKGEKLGKSAGNALWLDGEMTSPFDLYGYWLRQPDSDVEKYLKLFTFLPMETIRAAVAEHMQDPKQRKGQHLLAREFVELVHGEEVARKTEVQHRLIFSKPSAEVNEIKSLIGEQYAKTLMPNLNNVGATPATTTELPRSAVYTKALGQLTYAIGLASSRSDGHRLVKAGSIYIGGQGNAKFGKTMDDGAISWVKCGLWKVEKTRDFIVDDQFMIRKGKSKIKVIKMVDDEEWEKSGRRYPGDGKQPPFDLEEFVRKDEVNAIEGAENLQVGSSHGISPKFKGGVNPILERIMKPPLTEFEITIENAREAERLALELEETRILAIQQVRRGDIIEAAATKKSLRAIKRKNDDWLERTWGRDGFSPNLRGKRYNVRRDNAELVMTGWKQ